MDGTQERENWIILEHIENRAFCQNLIMALKAEHQSASSSASTTDTSLPIGDSRHSGTVIEIIMRKAADDEETKHILADIEDQVKRRDELLNTRTNSHDHTIV